jgi:hypothetical protein
VTKQDNSVEVRNISSSLTEGNLTQIANGVSPNEVVVTDGQDKLQAGSKVLPHFQNAASNAGATADANQPGTSQRPAGGHARPSGSVKAPNSGAANPGSPTAGSSNTGTPSQ